MLRAARVISLADLAEALGGEVAGDPDVVIHGAAGLEDAAPGTIVRVESERYRETALATSASAFLISTKMEPMPRPCIRVAQPKLAFARALELLRPEVRPAPGVHPTAVVDPQAELGEGCSIGPYAVIGRGARVGPGAVVHAHVVVGEEAEVGENSVLYPQVVLYPQTIVGSRVRIQSGTVVGSDGFGYEWSGREHTKIPQVGRVRIADDVEIGANTTIDRATTGETVIGPGTKVDNLVQIAHNVRTGAHCLIISQVGIAGSAVLGNGVVLAGQSGVKDHIKIGDGVMAGGKSGIWGDQPAGKMISGHPARPHREAVRLEAALGQLPQLLKRVKELERKLGLETEGEVTGKGE